MHFNLPNLMIGNDDNRILIWPTGLLDFLGPSNFDGDIQPLGGEQMEKIHCYNATLKINKMDVLIV
jgi:hypothetical protein